MGFFAGGVGQYGHTIYPEAVHFNTAKNYGLIQGQGYLYKVLRGLVFSFVKSLFFMSREPRKCTCIYVHTYHCFLVPINVHTFSLYFRAF